MTCVWIKENEMKTSYSLHRIFTEKTEKQEQNEEYADSLRRIFPEEESDLDSLLNSYASKTPIPQRHGVERQKL